MSLASGSLATKRCAFGLCPLLYDALSDRVPQTGKPKHYGFVEFDSSSVARIVADTMDNYLLMGHILTCKVIPKDQVHPELWVGANRKWRPVPRDRVARVAHNKVCLVPRMYPFLPRSFPAFFCPLLTEANGAYNL